ncbi:MAG: PD-(D/E)XK nuclease family protein [Clostridia bacterium]|nr:PD-(D/E)XK nuclease family protein [Clostridia bacterium]
MKIFTHPTSESIIKKTATLVKEVSDAQKKCVVFSEDKINLSLELEIAKALGGGFFDVDVFTFRRYVYSVSPSDKILSEQSSVMLIRKILAEKTSELSCFKGSALGPNMALTLYELISQLKSAKVSPSDLFGLIEGTHLKDGALRSKLCDVYLIYKTYCEYVLNSGFYDRNDYLSLMPQTVIGDPNLKGAVIILSGFPSVTRQRFDVFRALNTVASEVYAVVPYDENSSVYTGETLNRLLEIDGGASIISSPRLDFEKEALKKYLFSHDVFKSDFKPFTTDKISLYRAYDTADEIDFIARDIISEVRLSGYRYKDIVLAVGSLAETLPLLTRTFKDYNIPFYAEKQSSLAEHPLSQFIISFLDMARKGVPVKEFVKIIGHAVLISNKQVADGFISYIYKNAVSKYAVKKPFTFESENLSVYEGYRAKIIALCEELSKCKTVTDYIKAITNVIKTLNIENNVKELSKKLCAINELVSAEFNDDVLPKINDVLSEMENVLGGGKITALDFKNVLLSGFNATKVGAIPILNDAVYVGELKDIKLKGAKVLYALSLNGDVPFTQSDTSLLTDGDLAVLDGFNVIVEPKIKVVNDRDRESVLMALTSFEDKLKLSYSLVNSAQSAVYKSELIKSVTKIFNLNVLTRQAILDGIENGLEEYKKYELGAYSSRETALREIASTYTEYKLSSKNALKKVASFYEALEGLNYKDLIDKTNELFQDEEKDVYVDKAYVKSATSGEISATTLETFFSCPFKSYGQKILKLSETETGEVKANETGTLLHAVLERYVQNMDRVSDKYLQICSLKKL